MHMTDALISPQVAAALYLASGALLACSSRKLSKDPGFAERLPLAGVLGAFIFSAQMINFAIPGTGSSGHIGGGLLLSIILGPFASLLVMASIVLVQCLLFADGGLLALGCNIFNLGFWPAFVGLPVYLAIKKFGNSKAVKFSAAICAVVASLEAGAFSVVIETFLSGRSELPFSYFSAFMLGIHFPVAIVEGLLSVLVLALLERMNAPESKITAAPQVASASIYLSFIVIALFVAGIGAWFASAKPDGLEWSVARIIQAQELKAEEGPVHSLFAGIQEKTALLPDYSQPQISEDKSSRATAPDRWPQSGAGTSLSGVIGGFVVAIIVLLLGAALSLSRRASRKASA